MRPIKCSTGEICKTYPDYLKSRHWRQMKQKYKQHHHYSCTYCGRKSNLHLHHLTYERVGNESFEDLIYLCASCHAKVHNRTSTSTAYAVVLCLFMALVLMVIGALCK